MVANGSQDLQDLERQLRQAEKEQMGDADSKRQIEDQLDHQRNLRAEARLKAEIQQASSSCHCCCSLMAVHCCSLSCLKVQMHITHAVAPAYWTKPWRILRQCQGMLCA